MTEITKKQEIVRFFCEAANIDIPRQSSKNRAAYNSPKFEEQVFKAVFDTLLRYGVDGVVEAKYVRNKKSEVLRNV